MMFKKSKKLLITLSCAILMVSGCAITAFAGSSGTAYPTFPSWRNQVNVVSGTHSGPYTNVTLRGNCSNAFCNVIWGRTNVTGTFGVSWGNTVKAPNSAPQYSTVVLCMGNDDVSAYSVDASVTYNL